MAGVLGTYFDTCSLLRITGIPQNVLSCVNFMGQKDRHVLYNKKYTMCEYHYCAIIQSRVTGRHNTVTCSGGIMHFENDKFFNPVTPFIVDFTMMMEMPESSVELMGVDLDFYYAKDIRTTFSDDIYDLNCTNDFGTCLTFSNTSVCFGNTQGVGMVRSKEALVWGSMTSLVLGSFVLFVLAPRLKDRSSFYMILLYIIPFVSAILFYSGIILGPKVPFIMSGCLVFLLFPIVFYVFRDVGQNATQYKQVKLREETVKSRF